MKHREVSSANVTKMSLKYESSATFTVLGVMGLHITVYDHKKLIIKRLEALISVHVPLNPSIYITAKLLIFKVIPSESFSNSIHFSQN